MDNLTVRRTRDTIIAILNNSGLNAETKRLIAMEVFSLATKTAEEALAYEMNPPEESEVTDDEHQLE